MGSIPSAGSTLKAVFIRPFPLRINKNMDEKDKKIQALEKEINRLKKIMAGFEQKLKQVDSRVIRTNEQVRRVDGNAKKALSGVEQLSRRV